MAAKNLKNVEVKESKKFNLTDMLLADYIFVTKEGMQEFEKVLESRADNYFRNKKVSRPEHIEKWKAKRQNRFERDIILPILQD